MLHIIVAGILALPALSVNAISAIVIGILSIPSLSLLLYKKRGSSSSSSSSSFKFKEIPDHVIITGGSSGIGLSIAVECIKRGDIKRVTILARNPKKLETAKQLLLTTQKELVTDSKEANTIIQAIPVSVSDSEAIEKVAKDICEPNECNGDKIILFNCAGICHTTYMKDIPSSKYYELVQTNQLGAIYTTRAFLPYMTSTGENNKNGSGTVILTSSVAGQLGIFGYTCYSPTKSALRGFAETLHMEIASIDPGYNIQIAFPTDTDTPGYAEELKLMPEETKALNDTAGLASPDDLAKSMIYHAFAKQPKFFVYFGFEGWMLTALTSGMSPVSNMFDAITQVALMSLFRFVSLFYLNDFWRIIQSFQGKKQNVNGNNTKDMKKKVSSSDDAVVSPASSSVSSSQSGEVTNGKK